MVAGPGLPATASNPGRFRLERDETQLRRLHPHGGGIRETVVRRPRGLLRGSRIHGCAVGGAAVPALRGNAPRADRSAASVDRTAPRRSIGNACPAYKWNA